MGTTRLALYNDALLVCGQRFLATLDDDVESRRLLDQVWNNNGVQYCLEAGQWQFAMRFDRIDYDPDYTVEFGYRYVFNKPEDWILTSGMWSDERCRAPLSDYVDESENWRADITPIYVRYVSDDTSYGMNLGNWPATFCDFVSTYFAGQIITKLSQNKEMASAILQPRTGLLAIARKMALNAAAMTAGTRRTAPGSWVKSRRGFRGGPLGDGGSPGSLIG